MKRRGITGGAAVAEARAHAAKQAGLGKFLIKELLLMRSHSIKPSAVHLLDEEGNPLTSTDGKMKRWAEYFKEVMNRGKEVNRLVFERLPVVDAGFRESSQTPDSNNKLCSQWIADL